LVINIIIRRNNMLLTDTKSVIKFLDIEVLEEIASEFVTDTLEKQKQYPILEQIKEYWLEEAEEKLSNAKAIQLLQEIDFQAIADQFEEEAQEIADKKLEAKEYEENLDNWVYDKETGCWDERYPQ
tara:strand:+ start:1331 stop:1708 length:378 start_codon:yes stop_codon:yes gene_type:complete